MSPKTSRQQSKQQEHTKSIFTLRVLRYLRNEKHSYRIEKNDFLFCQAVSPGFWIKNAELGFYQTLADAEKEIQKVAKQNKGDIYGFFVGERPLNKLEDPYLFITCRRYFGDGSLWLESRTPFEGRNPETIRFKEGDFVEFEDHGYVRLGIVWSFLNESPHNDQYKIIDFAMTEDGKTSHAEWNMPAVKVLPPSCPVPRKFAAELRKQLKQAQEDELDNLPF